MIALYRGISKTSKLIRWVNWEPYSHAAWIDDDWSGYDSFWHKGVRHFNNFSDGHLENTHVDLFDVILNADDHAGLIEFFEKQTGKPYDWSGVFSFFPRRQISDHTADDWFCSSLIFAGFNWIKKPLLLRVPAWKVTPGMLAYSPLLKAAGTVAINKSIQKKWTGK